MTKDEKVTQIQAKVQQIRDLYPDQPYLLQSRMRELLGLISELEQLTPEDSLIEDGPVPERSHYRIAWHEVAHIMNKECGHLMQTYANAHKSKAATIRQQEYLDEFSKLLERVDRDVFMIGRV